MTIEAKRLPYDLQALEPHLDKLEVDLHYNKHYKTYVKNVNKLTKGTTNENKTIEQIIKSEQSGHVFNNASQVWNHEFYFDCMCSPDKSKFDDKSDVGKTIISVYKSYDQFKEKFTKASKTLFGSGWVCLVTTEDKKTLNIVSLKDAASVLNKTHSIPLLLIDVWEHAYSYQRDYMAERGKYIDNWFKVINWEFVERQYIGQ